MYVRPELWPFMSVRITKVFLSSAVSDPETRLPSDFCFASPSMNTLTISCYIFFVFSLFLFRLSIDELLDDFMV
jgi:hypothetical protein